MTEEKTAKVVENTEKNGSVCLKSRGELARELFREGYNCSQAVLGAFAEDAGLDVKTALRLSAPFGGGMGRMREVCGGVSGMFMAIGLFFGYDEPDGAQAKKELYSYVRALADKFKESEGSIICRELLAGVKTQPGPDPEPRNTADYKKRPCPELVAYAAQLTEDFLNEHGKLK